VAVLVQQPPITVILVALVAVVITLETAVLAQQIKDMRVVMAMDTLEMFTPQVAEVVLVRLAQTGI
jgi:hypothetical protein